MNKRIPILTSLLVLLGACAHQPPTIPPVKNVELERFMGDWYVIGNIPSWVEREVYNAVERYELADDGRVLTTFTYRKGSFDAPVKTMQPVGRVREGTNNAVWGMRFVWPIDAEYVIVYLNDDYTQTIVGRSDRDYAWFMARTPTVSEADYAHAKQMLQDFGYDVSKLRKVPQRW